MQQRLVAPISPGLRRWFVDKLAILAYAGDVPKQASGQSAGKETAIGVPLPLERSPGQLIRRAEQLHGAHWLSLVGSRLTPPQYGLMRGIASQPGRNLLDQRQAGERAGLDKASMSNFAARLTRCGLIGREPDQRDRRRKLLYLTDEAWELMAEVEPAVRGVQAALVEPLGERDAATLTSLLRKVAYRE